MAYELKLAQERITKSLTKILPDSQSEMFLASNGFASELEKDCKDLDTNLRLDVNGLIESYLLQYTEIERRMDERFNRLSSMDKADKDLKYMEQKSVSNTGISIEDYRKNCNVLKFNYESLNTELKRDMTNLLEDGKHFLEVLYPCIANAQLKHINACNESAMAKLTKVASLSTLEKARSYPPKITPNASSAMYFNKPTQSVPAPVPKPAVKTVPTARALYSYNSMEPNELSFKAGDVLQIFSQEEGWWKAELNGKMGLVPSNYVQIDPFVSK